MRATFPKRTQGASHLNVFVFNWDEHFLEMLAKNVYRVIKNGDLTKLAILIDFFYWFVLVFGSSELSRLTACLGNVCRLCRLVTALCSMYFVTVCA
jgi:hypothetical protein